MNHLKHIRGISVRASSNAALSSHYGHHNNIYFENYKLKQLRRSNPSFAEKSYDIDVKHLGQFRQGSLRFVSKESKTICKQHSKTKSSMTSLKKKSLILKRLPSENIAKRVYHYSTCQNVKFNNNEINKQFIIHNNVIINSTKDINRRSFMATIEKYPRPRSYAEMIADYSESLYKESTVGARKDSLYFNNAIRKSPFSTFSVSPRAKKIMNITEYSELSIERQKSDFLFPVKSFDFYNPRNNINIDCYDFQHHSTCTAETMNKNINQNCVITNDNLKNDESYAKLVADCSKSLHNIPITNVLNDNLESKRNMLRRNSFESVITTTRRTSDTQETTRKIIPAIRTMPLEKNIKEKMINLKENDWLKEMENVISDLKNVTDRKVARVDVPKIKIPDNQKEKDTTIRKLSCQSDKINRMEKHKKILELQKHNYSHSSGKISNLSQYFSNTAENSVKKNSTLVSTSDNTDVLKQPQIKLRMVPSEKESVVSINVDQDSFGSVDPLNSISKHLSVVVQSDQKEDVKLMNNQLNVPTLQRTNKSALQSNAFGPMHISISEDSAPVKQIEFSINGKPVSELKSITARTEKLDVVSSADKIEIRIPFVKDDSNVLRKTREDDLSKGIKPKGQILNVQISANFQDESTKDSSIEKPAKTIQYRKDTIPISQSPMSKTTSNLSNNFPKETFSSNNIQQYECTKRMDIQFDNNEKNIQKYRTGTSLIKEANNVEIENLNMRRSNTTGFTTEANKYNKNESSDNRVPSKMIPWWASSDSFNKIRKKENDDRSLISSSNKNQYKSISNLNQNFVTESLSTPKKTSNSKIPKRIQLMNNITTNNSSNASPNSINPYEESKSSLHYACSFRLKSNQGYPNMPEIIRNDLKTEDKQALTAEKDINKISGIKQMESITLFKSDTMNIKSKRDIDIKKKTFVQEKIKLSSAQNLSSTTQQEVKNNYSLKQTKSIDDVSKNIKSKIDILDVIKPIENNENGITDYGLKVSSRQLTAKLNNAAKEIQNPITIIKDFPNSSTAKIVSKKFDKTMITKQTEPINIKLKLKSDISPKKENLTMKNDTIINLKALNNNVNNIQEVDKNFISSNSPNLKNFPQLSQTLKKQEQFANNNIIYQDKSKQDLKSLSKINDKNECSSLITSSLTTSSEMMQKSEISGKILLKESKKNRPKSLTSIKNTLETNQEFKKLKNLTSLTSVNPSKESLNTIMIDKLPLQTKKQIQSKPFKNANMTRIANINKLSSSQTMSTSKTKDCIISKNLIDKNAKEISQSVETKRTKVRDTIAKVITENPKSKNLLPKECEENCFKAELNKEYLSRSAGSSKKPNVSISFKSAGSNMKSRSATFEVRQNLNDVDMPQYPALNVNRSNGLWINMDRPEKNILYSAWLQRSENDIKKNEKLF